MQTIKLCSAAVALSLASSLTACGGGSDADSTAVPHEIRQVLNKPAYRDAIWGVRVIDLDTGEVLQSMNSDRMMLVASVRKLFSVGSALETLGPDHVFRTPVHRQGTVDGAGNLTGDLILVASGDMAMGGRTNPDGSFAISHYDHGEANSLGNAELTAPDPLAGFDALARQVAAAGIRHVNGDVVIDDRLFEPFDFRGEFDVRPIFVNDDLIDMIIDPQGVVDWRAKSAAFTVQSALTLGAVGSDLTAELDPELPQCIGQPGCSGQILGSLPAGYVPPLTGSFPLIRTFRIVQPSNYARTVFIEALARAGVTVAAPAVMPNPVGKLPADKVYADATRVAELGSHPYRDHAKLTLKVSYNVGADLSLMLFGVAKGQTTIGGALAAEQQFLTTQFGIPSDQMHFIDGSGGGDTTATPTAVTHLLRAMSSKPSFAAYVDAQPSLGVDGSLSFVTDFEADPSLAGAKAQVHAKTGTYVEGSPQGAVLKTQALAGYVNAKSGRRLAFALMVNDVAGISGVDDVLPVFQDEGRIAAILWKLY